MNSCLFMICLLQITENNVTMDTKVTSSFLGYHHEEIHYWLGVLTRLRDERGVKPKPLAVNESKQR